jgi:hypothetical protein
MGLSIEDTSFAKYFRKEGLEEGVFGWRSGR